MVNRLEPINLVSFTGGLNLRKSQFELAEDESPDMLNVDLDPRGGFCSRRGWQRWSLDDIVDVTTTAWKPCNAYVINYSDGERDIYIANESSIYYADHTAEFAQLPGVVGEAGHYCADFATWSDDVYIALGMSHAPVRVNEAHVVTTLAPTFSEVDAPVSNAMFPCELVEGHGGYLFCAVTREGGVDYPNRLRFSHPIRPDSWRTDDFIDIETGGGRITNLMSFSDHLLIFKTDSMWALYGYDSTSWQLVEKSTSIGLPGPTASTRSENAVYFYSSSNRSGIYGYNGNQPQYLSEALRPAFEELTACDNVFVSWAARRLWVSVPWVFGVGAVQDISTVFVMDPAISAQGAWVLYRSEYGCPGPIVDGTDTQGRVPLSAFWSDFTAAVVALDATDAAYDLLDNGFTIGATAGGVLIGDIATTALDPIGGGQPVSGVFSDRGRPFDSYYRTRWLHAGWPDRKKSWRRPTFVCRQVPADVNLLVETYRDYDESTVQRTRTLHVRAKGSAVWTEGGFADHDIGGFDWTPGGKADPSGRGANWGQGIRGSTLERAGSQGLARSVQMCVRLSPETPQRRWGIDAIVCKIIMRRFR